MMVDGMKVDGRTARSERTRKAIVDAHVRLIQDGDLRPTADRIARAAGVSLRALWSHFADMEALFAASGRRILEQRDAAWEPVSPALPLPERIDAYCAQRARLLEQIATAAQAASLKEPFSPVLQQHRRLHMERVRDEVEALFAPEPPVRDAVVAVSMAPTWGTWRTTMGLTADEAEHALRQTVRALLTGR